MYNQISINGEVVNLLQVKVVQNNGAWLNVYVDNTDNLGVPVACHSLPKQWFDGDSQSPIVTGGNEYNKIRPGF